MTDTQTRQDENQHLRERLEELEETLRAIRSGEVDALVMSRPEGEQVYTLKGALESVAQADRPLRRNSGGCRDKHQSRCRKRRH